MAYRPMCLNFALVIVLCLPSAGHSEQARDTSARKAKPMERWAFLVGVDDYVHARKLEFCGEDMRELRGQLLAAGFPESHILLLHDKAEQTKYRPVKANIERELQAFLKTVGADDLAVVAFAGHGVEKKPQQEAAGKQPERQSKENPTYLLAADSNLDEPATMISVATLYDNLRASPARFKLMIVDACRADPNPRGPRSPALTAQTRGFLTSLEQLPKGIVLLTSCAPGQISWEHKDLKHGVFTNFLLEGIKGAAADGGGTVSLFGLYNYVNRETKSYVLQQYSKPQTPVLTGQFTDDPNVDRNEDLKVPLFRHSPKEFVNSIGMKLVLVPAGEFMMGAPGSEQGSEPCERPQHRVRITRPFYMGAYEVTQAEFERVMGYNPSFSRADERKELAGLDTSRFPADHVYWSVAVTFCLKLSDSPDEKAAGRVYRLPTEAEWEYACRAGTTTPFNFGRVCNGIQGNCRGTHPYGTEEKGPSLQRTTTVGSYQPNAFGLYDMHGNVSEWCADTWSADYYKQSSSDDPFCSSMSYRRVKRGGKAYTDPESCRSGARDDTGSAVCCGFRVVCADPSGEARPPVENSVHVQLVRGDYCNEKGDVGGAIGHFTEVIRTIRKARGERPPCELKSRGEFRNPYNDISGPKIDDSDDWFRLYLRACMERAVLYFVKASQGKTDSKRELDSAIADFTETIRLRHHVNFSPYEGYFLRAEAYFDKGDFVNADRDYTAALTLTKARGIGDPALWESVSWFLATCPDAKFRDGKRAVEFALDVVENNKGADDMQTLAAAYAEAGEFDKAVQTQQEAIKDPELAKAPKELQEARERLKLYQNKKPIRAEQSLIGLKLYQNKKPTREEQRLKPQPAD